MPTGDANKIPIAIWNTDIKKLIAIVDSISTATVFITGERKEVNLKVIYAIKNTGIIIKEKTKLNHNVKVKYANAEQIKLLNNQKILIL